MTNAPEPTLVQRLEEARREAVEAILVAEEAEKVARSKRRHANNLQKKYDRLLLESQGQLRIPGVPGD